MCKVLRTFLEWSAHCCVRMVCHNKYHRVGSLNSQSSFLSILDIRKTKIKVPAMSSSWGGCRWQPSCCALTRHKETRALWCLLLQGHELTPLISSHPLTSWLLTPVHAMLGEWSVCELGGSTVQSLWSLCVTPGDWQGIASPVPLLTCHHTHRQQSMQRVCCIPIFMITHFPCFSWEICCFSPNLNLRPILLTTLELKLPKIVSLEIWQIY